MSTAPRDDEQAEAARVEAWRGALPAVFTLAADEVTTLRPPRPFHLNLPRQTLLPFVCEAVRKHFVQIAFVSAGQSPATLSLQKAMHVQLTGAPLPDGAGEPRLALAVLVKAALGKRILCVIDDVRAPAPIQEAPGRVACLPPMAQGSLSRGLRALPTLPIGSQ